MAIPRPTLFNLRGTFASETRGMLQHTPQGLKRQSLLPTIAPWPVVASFCCETRLGQWFWPILIIVSISFQHESWSITFVAVGHSFWFYCNHWQSWYSQAQDLSIVFDTVSCQSALTALESAPWRLRLHCSRGRFLVLGGFDSRLSRLDNGDSDPCNFPNPNVAKSASSLQF